MKVAIEQHVTAGSAYLASLLAVTLTDGLGDEHTLRYPLEGGTCKQDKDGWREVAFGACCRIRRAPPDKVGDEFVAFCAPGVDVFGVDLDGTWRRAAEIALNGPLPPIAPLCPTCQKPLTATGATSFRCEGCEAKAVAGAA